MPGFDLAKAAAEAYEKNPQVVGLVLLNHGLFTFGETAKESYDAHIKAVTQAETYIQNNPRQPLTPATDSGAANDPEILKAITPILRGLYREQSGSSWVIHHRESGVAREFASSKECKKWSQIGTATPDHVIRTKQKPLLLNPKHLNNPERLRSELKEALNRYEKAYHKYFVTNQARKGIDMKELDPLPRVLLVAGLGLVTVGKTVKETRIAADLYEHTIEIIQSAFDVGAYAPLPEADLFDMEYWSLEQAKLGKAQPPLMQGQVAYITGAASGIGLATAHLFAQKGTNVYLVDLNGKALEKAGTALQKMSKASVTWRAVDLTDEEAVAASFEHAVQTYGGVDILISNAGNAVQGRIGEVDSATLRGSFDLNFFAHQTVAAQAVNIFLKQKTGGALLFNASKAAFNPGKDFGPYALPKAAVIALVKQYALDYGKEGVRSNAVNADRIRTGMFTDQFIAERSKARGLEPEEYFRQNLLGREVLDTDVAEAFLHLALSEKTTGSVFTVDGGNIAASPR